MKKMTKIILTTSMALSANYTIKPIYTTFENRENRELCVFVENLPEATRKRYPQPFTDQTFDLKSRARKTYQFPTDRSAGYRGMGLVAVCKGTCDGVCKNFITGIEKDGNGKPTFKTNTDNNHYTSTRFGDDYAHIYFDREKIDLDETKNCTPFGLLERSPYKKSPNATIGIGWACRCKNDPRVCAQERLEYRMIPKNLTGK